MIVIQSKNKITKAQADSFNDSQEQNGLVRLKPISVEDCKWRLEVRNYAIRKGFQAQVRWYQLQEFETGNPETPTEIRPVLIYRENFSLDSATVQNLWEQLQGEILSVDNLDRKIEQFSAQGVLIWLGRREAFELTSSDFEILE